MGKKYIIELLDDCQSEFKGIMAFGLTQEKQISVELIPEEGLRPYTEPDLEQVKSDAYNDGYKAGREAEEVRQKLRQPDLEQVKCEAYEEGRNSLLIEVQKAGKNKIKLEEDEYYQRGLSDAWEAARKVVALSTVDRRKVFGSEYMYSILEKHTASEAIEKLKAYEQEEQIQIGDEVIAASGKAVVTAVGPVYFEFVYANGAIGSDKVKNVKKTGRCFPEIAEVLQKMKESE